MKTKKKKKEFLDNEELIIVISLTDEDKKIIRYGLIPVLIYTLCIGCIVILGSLFGKLSEDEINAYMTSMVLAFFINYINIAFVKFSYNKDCEEDK